MSDENIPQMRERIDQLEKALKGLEKSNEELTSTNLTLQAREVARGQGYSPSVGDLFAKAVGGEPTAEALAQFADTHGLKPAEAASASTDASSDGDGSGDSGASTALASMSGGSSTSGSGGQQTTGSKTMTRQDYNDLHKSDPVAARQALMEGRVELRSDNPFAVQR